MADAYVMINGGYAPYLTGLPVPPDDTSWGAAIGEAARVTLSDLYKTQSAHFSAAMSDYLETLFVSPESIHAGLGYGRELALRMLKERMDDNSTDDTQYVPVDAPGRHRPDPLHTDQGFLTPGWGKVKTFGIGGVTAFRAPAPPPLNSAEYRDNFNDVKETGARTGSTRAPEETLIGIFWGYDGAQKLGTPPRLYNQIARVIAADQCNTICDNARMFALINIAMADAGIQCWESKYHYNLWRPVVGIREASYDGNDETLADPYWEPLGAPATNPLPGATNFTPNFPAYPSGHATFGAASLGMIRLFYHNKDEICFEFVSDELNGESVDADGSVRVLHKRQFRKLSDAILENARSRVFLGVHWQFDADAGVEAGEAIAKHIFDNQLRSDE
jgi:hypothetical protein